MPSRKDQVRIAKGAILPETGGRLLKRARFLPSDGTADALAILGALIGISEATAETWPDDPRFGFVLIATM
jgi:hypothetical protein